MHKTKLITALYSLNKLHGCLSLLCVCSQGRHLIRGGGGTFIFKAILQEFWKVFTFTVDMELFSFTVCIGWDMCSLECIIFDFF